MKVDYTGVYEKLDKLTNGIEKFLNQEEVLRLKSSGYMDLVVEPLGEDTISMTHYFELNGDLVPDPDMMIRVDLKNKTAEALTYQDLMMYQQVYSDDGKSFNPRVNKSINSFLNQWLSNLKMQGFYK